MKKIQPKFEESHLIKKLNSLTEGKTLFVLYCIYDWNTV